MLTRNIRLLMLVVVGVIGHALHSLGAEPAARVAKKAFPALHVLVTAKDAKTGKPIEAIRVVATSRDGNEQHVTWQSHVRKEFTESPAEYTMERGWEEMILRIDAEGYLPVITRTFKRHEGKQDLEVLLQPDAGLVGTVLQPDGMPADGAMIGLATWTNEVNVSDGRLRMGSHGEKLRPLVQSAADGTFRLPSEIDPWVIVIAHESGYVEAEAGDFAKSNTLQLKPWGRVEGDVIVAGTPIPDCLVTSSAGRGGIDVNVHYGAETTTDAEGHFAIERVAPVRQYIHPNFKSGDSTYSMTWFSGNVEVAPGETTKIQLPRGGAPIVGRIELPPGMKREDLTIDLEISLRPPSVSGDQGWVRKSFAAYGDFMATDIGKAFQRSEVPVAEDGSFRIEGLPETYYVIAVRAYSKKDTGFHDPTKSLAFYGGRVEAPPFAGADAPLDLGTIRIKTREESEKK